MVEDPQISGHSGFNHGRDQLLVAFANAGHGSQYQYWGNTRTLRQCNGSYVGSNGAAFQINVGHTH